MKTPAVPADSMLEDFDWHKIEDLLDQFGELSKSEVSAAEFYRLLLNRLVPATAAAAGGIWQSARAELRLQAQVNLLAGDARQNEELLRLHRQFVEDALRTGCPQMVPPRARDPFGEDASEPEGCWLILYPFRIEQPNPCLIELEYRPAATLAAGRAYLRVLTACAEITEDFSRMCELRELRRREQSWLQTASFVRRVHQSLDANRVAAWIANEGRKVLDCDRISVLVCRGGRCRTAAISGVHTFDRRAQSVRALEQLANRCVATGDSVLYGDGSLDIPDQIEQPLHAYLDDSHSRVVSIEPLRLPETQSTARPAPVVGAIVAEYFQATGSGPELRDRVLAIAGHCAVALGNAVAHTDLPLSWLGRALAQIRWLSRARQLPKTVLVLALVAMIAAGLALIPADFAIEARGELQPRARRDVFASDDGVVTELQVRHGQAITTAAPLLVIRKPELDLELHRVTGELRTAEKRLAAVQAERLSNLPNSPDGHRGAHQLTADEEELKELLDGLHRQQEIVERQRSNLVVRSPIGGQVLTWNIEQQLNTRPVQRGQSLLTVADLDGPWVLELHVPDDRAGHVLKARDHLQRALEVSFTLSSEPGAVYQGQVADVSLVAEADESNRSTVLVMVDFDRRDVVGLRAGVVATAKIHCGQRSVGYVWFHDLFEFVQSLMW